jgi:hypothetical protein
VEDLDDENHLVIKESQLENLKARLDHVCSRRGYRSPSSCQYRTMVQ